MDKANAHPAAGSDLAVLDLLAADRLRTLALCQALHHDFESIVEASTSSNADDEHDPEGATVAFERSQVLALLAQCQSRLDDIDRALLRYEHGSYGICESCGGAIPAERLAARPSASTCVRCAATAR
jgi:RNA polymerase-binding transcription factor DksA